MESINLLRRTYNSPLIRIMPIKCDISFLISNTEPIVDDGQEHGWE